MKFKILTTIGMLLLILGLLLTAFQVAIYGDSDYGFYEREYETYGVDKILNMTDYDIMIVTEYMMDYLIGKEEELSIEIMVDGEYQDFFNEQDRLHMADVRNLFLGGLMLRNFCILGSLVLLILATMGNYRDQSMGKGYLFGYLRAMFVTAVFVIVITAGCVINFDASFRLFHHIFFTNDLWIFDPTTDYMINMLPEGFFFDFVVWIAMIFGGFLLGLTVILVVLALLLAFFNKKKDLPQLN